MIITCTPTIQKIYKEKRWLVVEEVKTCSRCKNPFWVTDSHQKYCEKCRKELERVWSREHDITYCQRKGSTRPKKYGENVYLAKKELSFEQHLKNVYEKNNEGWC